MLTVKQEKHGLSIIVDDKLVLTIEELSNDENINLLLSPVNPKCCIVKSGIYEGEEVYWTHEVIVERKELL